MGGFTISIDQDNRIGDTKTQYAVCMIHYIFTFGWMSAHCLREAPTTMRKKVNKCTEHTYRSRGVLYSDINYLFSH